MSSYETIYGETSYAMGGYADSEGPRLRPAAVGVSERLLLLLLPAALSSP